MVPAASPLVVGTFTGVTLPGADNASSVVAASVNNAGDIIGFFFNGAVTPGFLDIGSNFTDFEANGSTNTMFLGINNNGDVVGVYQDAQGFNTASFTPSQPAVTRRLTIPTPSV